MKSFAFKDLLRDLWRAVLLGLCSAGVLSLLLFVGGFLFGGLAWRSGLQIIRSGLLIIGALALFVCAGLMIRPEAGLRVRDRAGWKKHFSVFGLLPVALILAVSILAAACIADYILLSI